MLNGGMLANAYGDQLLMPSVMMEILSHVFITALGLRWILTSFLLI